MPHRSDTKCPGFEKDGRHHACIGTGVKHWEAFRCAACAAEAKTHRILSPAKQVEYDRKEKRLEADLNRVRSLYNEAQKTVDRQEHELSAINVLRQGVNAFAIKPKHGHHTSEGTAVIVASDWHVEERVAGEVGGLNTYSLDIAKKRATQFFQGGLRLVNLLEQDIAIPTVVLALLGDFISNDIHEEFPDVNQLTPMHAIVYAQNLLISGIEFWLANSKFNLVIPCHSGNHARTTKTTRFSVENGHSLEYLMYLHLAAYFRNEPRVKFIIPEGYHSFMNIYGTIVRFHHGHSVKYNGGVGGLYIPVNKAIGQWNKARQADLDVFGHFHQQRDGGNFVSNGSLIGYNGFAIAIKADFEPPKQVMFLMDKKRGKTATWPILVE